MRVLLDGNLPKKVARMLSGHDALTIHQEGWSNLSNGALLDAAAGKYSVFITLDQNLSYDALESKRRMRRIRFEELEAFVRQGANPSW